MKWMRDIAEMMLILAVMIAGLFAGFVDVGVPVNLGIMLACTIGPIAAVVVSMDLIDIAETYETQEDEV